MPTDELTKEMSASFNTATLNSSPQAETPRDTTVSRGSPHLFCSIMDEDVCYTCHRQKMMQSYYNNFDNDQAIAPESPILPLLKKNEIAQRKSIEVGASFLPKIDAIDSPRAPVAEEVNRYAPLPNISSPSIGDGLSNSNDRLAADSLRLPPIQDQGDLRRPRKRDMKKKQLEDFVQREFGRPLNEMKGELGTTATVLPSIGTRAPRATPNGEQASQMDYRSLQEEYRTARADYRAAQADSRTPRTDYRATQLTEWKSELYARMRASENFPNLLESLMNDMEESQRMDQELSEEEGANKKAWKKLLVAKHDISGE